MVIQRVVTIILTIHLLVDAVEEVYCKMGVDVEGLGTLYHFQKFIPSNLSNFAQYGNFTPSSATLSTNNSTQMILDHITTDIQQIILVLVVLV